MRFNKLSLKNIRSYKNEKIIFPDGSLLLAGEIGSGKTTILLAIEYALFGLQPGQKGSALLRNSSSIGEVSLEFEIDGKEIIIDRKLKRSQKSITNEYAAITIDGEKLESSVTEIKTKIIDLLGYPLDFIKKNNILYRYTVYTPQESMKQIILEEAETRLNILRHVFGIDKYKRIRENSTILINYLKEVSKVLQIEIKDLEHYKLLSDASKTRISELQSNLDIKLIDFKVLKELRKEIEISSQSLEENLKQKNVMQSQLDKTFALIEAKRESLSYTLKEIAEIKNSLQLKEVFSKESYDSLLSSLSTKNKDLDIINTSLIEIMGSISSSKKEIDENLIKRERIFRIHTCPTCLQNVPEIHKHNIQNAADSSIAEIKRKLIILEGDKKNKSSLIESIKKEINYLLERKSELEILRTKSEFIEKAKVKLMEMEKNKESIEKDISLLERHIMDVKENISSFTKMELQFKNKNAELKSHSDREKLIEISIAEIKKEIEMTEKEISNLNLEIEKKEKKKKELSNVLQLNDWLSAQFTNLVDFIERNVLIRVRREFSSLFGKWFSILVPTDSFQVYLDESFTPVITHKETEMEYSALSGGERTAVALAYRLSLNQTINSVLSKIKTRDIVILDEPTEGFSDSQLDKIRDVLDELNIKQLIIVSHEQKIEGFVDNIIRLKKTADISYIDESSLLPDDKLIVNEEENIVVNPEAVIEN